MWNYPHLANRNFRDARVRRFYHGTSQILLRVVAKHMIRIFQG